MSKLLTRFTRQRRYDLLGNEDNSHDRQKLFDTSTDNKCYDYGNEEITHDEDDAHSLDRGTVKKRDVFSSVLRRVKLVGETILSFGYFWQPTELNPLRHDSESDILRLISNI